LATLIPREVIFRSVTAMAATTVRTRTKLGDCAFSTTGPLVGYGTVFHHQSGSQTHTWNSAYFVKTLYLCIHSTH